MRDNAPFPTSFGLFFPHCCAFFLQPMAYAERCALCRLKKSALLDAAHILADSQGSQLDVPRRKIQRPSDEYLETRFAAFKDAS